MDTSVRTYGHAWFDREEASDEAQCHSKSNRPDEDAANDLRAELSPIGMQLASNQSKPGGGAGEKLGRGLRTYVRTHPSWEEDYERTYVLEAEPRLETRQGRRQANP